MTNNYQLKTSKTIHIATDHAGFEHRQALAQWLSDKGYEVIDHGAESYDKTDDYPDFVHPCAQAVSIDAESRGIIFGGSGQGEAMTANRHPNVRAAVWYGGETEIIALSRRHNDANILSLGARYISIAEMIDAVSLWLGTEFEGGRHVERINKIDTPKND